MWKCIRWGLGRRFLKDRKGATAVEFAFIFPVFLTMVVAIMEFSYHHLLNTVIESAALEASRFGITGDTGGGGETREERITRTIKENTYGLMTVTDLVIDTLVYDSFEDIGKPEPWADANLNGRYDFGETFTDVNGNTVWDADLGRAGLGSATDIVVYRIRYVSQGLTGLLAPFLTSYQHESIVAVRNEPY